ncbi:MAG: hypothetical protein ACRDRT_06760, partial [Pseudonocardiaceae bacterium]
MASPFFRYHPRIQEVLSAIPEVADAAPSGELAAMVELLYRRDRQLEDWLQNYGDGKEYATVVVASA